MAYTTIDNPELYFQVKTYTGNGGTLAITLDGSENMSPDFVWIKERNLTSSHALTDTVRGNTKKLKSDDTDVEETNTNLITSFDSDGFTLGDNGNANQSSSQTYVAWNWKAGTSFTNDASATGIGDIDSSGSVNTTSGFSIITATSDGAANKDIAHGLGAVPDVIFAKNLVRTYNWDCYFKTLGYNASLILNETNATRTGAWGSNTFTTTTFETGNNFSSESGEAYIYYCFAEKQGYSKFGSYTGNGNADGAFVYTGFKPAWLLVKQSSADGEGWLIFDSKRLGYNGGNSSHYADSYATEASGGYVDLLSNGFKAISTNGVVNTSGATYIYMAFAENPFVTSSGVPATAR